MIKVKVDTTGFERLLDKISGSLENFEMKALMEMGDTLLNLSVREVPHDQGILQSSGVVERGDHEVIVGFHTPYAARLHEHPEYRFQKGRKGKYLEDPLKMNLRKWEAVYADQMGALL